MSAMEQDVRHWKKTDAIGTIFRPGGGGRHPVIDPQRKIILSFQREAGIEPAHLQGSSPPGLSINSVYPSLLVGG
jgi:hypothetical protein